jgi:predicted acyl esterase
MFKARVLLKDRVAAIHPVQLRTNRNLKRLHRALNMPNHIQNISSVGTVTYPYIFEQNVSIPLTRTGLPVRANVYRPKTKGQVPVLATLGPYGKDVPYAVYVPSLPHE